MIFFEHACVPQHHHNFEKINLLWLELLFTNLIVLTSNLFQCCYLQHRYFYDWSNTPSQQGWKDCMKGSKRIHMTR